LAPLISTARQAVGIVTLEQDVIEELRIVTDEFHVVTGDITPEFITELDSSSGQFGPEAAAERVQVLADCFARAEAYAEQTGEA
jgi:hypothetical protein